MVMRKPLLFRDMGRLVTNQLKCHFSAVFALFLLALWFCAVENPDTGQGDLFFPEYFDHDSSYKEKQFITKTNCLFLSHN